MNISLSCPQCQQQVELGDCFCQECGSRLEFAVITTANIDRDAPQIVDAIVLPEPAVKNEVAAGADLLLSELLSEVKVEEERTATILRHRPHQDRLPQAKAVNAHKQATWSRPSTDAIALMVMVSYSVLLVVWFVNSQTRDFKNNPVHSAARPAVAPAPSKTITSKENKLPINQPSVIGTKSTPAVKDGAKPVPTEEKLPLPTVSEKSEPAPTAQFKPPLEAVQEPSIPRSGTFFVGGSGSGSSSMSSGVIIEESPNQSKSDKKQIAEASPPTEEYQDKDVAEYHRLLANYFERQKGTTAPEGEAPQEPPSYGEWLNQGKPAF